MEKLCDLYRHLGNSLDLLETFSTLDRELRLLVDYEALSVHLVEQERLQPAYVSGAESLRLVALAGVQENLLGRALEKRQVFLNEPVQGLGALARALVAPLESEGMAIGVLALYRGERSAFSEQDRQVVQGLHDKLAVAIENARSHRRAEQRAGIEPLTQLPDARTLFGRLDAELSRARRDRGQLAVLACAVDGLAAPGLVARPVHPDPALEQIGSALRRACREYDLAAYTGDEFVLLLPGFARTGMAEKQAQIARIVEEAGQNAGLPLSVRIGEAFFPEDGSDAEDLLAAGWRRLQETRRR